jgi:hypothetical protein
MEDSGECGFSYSGQRTYVTEIVNYSCCLCELRESESGKFMVITVSITDNDKLFIQCS